MATLEVGRKAPDFVLQDQNGKTVRLSDYRGRKVLIYFYPKADTPGCTTQSCSVRDSRRDLGRLSAAAIGISPDPVKDQKKFDEKYSLGFPLLADTEQKAAEEYGVRKVPHFSSTRMECSFASGTR
jgi:peroxiredoxin Q/BCP